MYIWLQYMKQHEIIKRKERNINMSLMCVTYQTTCGSGQPLTVQCRRTHCFSHTVWERGLITNSGECIRLSTFMRLKCSSCSWIWKKRHQHHKESGQESGQGELLQWVKIHDAETTQSRVQHVQLACAGIQFSRAWARAGYLNISAGVQAWLFAHQLSQSSTTTQVGSRSSVSQETQSPEESLTHWGCDRVYYTTRITVASIILI